MCSSETIDGLVRLVSYLLWDSRFGDDDLNFIELPIQRPQQQRKKMKNVYGTKRNNKKSVANCFAR